MYVLQTWISAGSFLHRSPVSENAPSGAFLIISGVQTIASRSLAPLHLVVHAGITLAPCYPSPELQVH
nr:MAG TPA: hypothetical protein [Caudoviricetes sp.]